ncbi:hypothetical protein [Psychrobacillus sp. FSL H8-0487]|uniref:hypothetical protein n=1 Tax=Psychrobacillus sp. FSL H8-0487 TaxID=2921391 RepID=UPI0030FB8E85
MKYLISMAIGLSFLLFQGDITFASTTEGYDLSTIRETSENVSLDSLGVLAKEYSIPILVIMVIIAGFSALLGLIFKPLKAVAGSIFGIGIVFYLLVNFAPQITGVLISVVDSVMNRVTGG